MDTPTTPTAKPWWQSKTVLLNAVALVAMLVPVAREWIEKNPVTVVQALAAAGLLLRFVTSGKISIFGDDDDSLSGQTSGGTGVSAGKSTGRDTGGVGNGKTRTPGILWLVAPACVLLCLVIPSCTVGVDSTGGWSIKPDPHSVDAALRYAIRHDEDSAKSGLTQWEYFDPETGEKIKPADYAAWGITASPAR